jgi:hypothetical protein
MQHASWLLIAVISIRQTSVRTENGNNFGYEKITILGDNMPLKAYRLSELIFLFISM